MSELCHLLPEAEPERVQVPFWDEPLTLEQLCALREMLGVVIHCRERTASIANYEIFIDDDAATLVLSREGLASPTGETPG